ncbi:hypothetical protein BDA99DRAFT_528979 [Phascolomyces articulosus]|uniref:Uncharacterized protein n=1 Tax=Phascolomyces articulosus TaxID=60185 RepID=A0AAD5JWU4_9FUNG|nr:hypothetical protein BDA99DRAFT_528979 [Phascolomyces articulosus]
MSEECYWFWVANFGYATMESSWDQFINGYELLYGTLDPHVMKSMEQLLCQDNKVSVARLIIATRKHSNQFPFTKNIGSSSLSTTSVAPETKDQMSEEKRMQLTEMAMELVEKFSDVKMGNHLVSIYSWYRGYDKKDKKAMRERANEWAELIKERRKILGENKKELLQVKHEEAERIDQARRAVYFFYEQFVTIWRVGEVTREILKSVDFPGKGRMRDFLNYVAPLDQANFYVIIGGSKGKDDEKKDYRPKLYDFMEMYLTMLEQQSKERKEDASQKPIGDNKKSSNTQ